MQKGPFFKTVINTLGKLVEACDWDTRNWSWKLDPNCFHACIRVEFPSCLDGPACAAAEKGPLILAVVRCREQGRPHVCHTCTLTSAPLLTRNSRQSAPCVEAAAKCSGVKPLLLGWLTLAPQSISSLATKSWPLKQARWRAVFPKALDSSICGHRDNIVTASLSLCVCVYIYLHSQVEQMLDHSDLSTGGCCVQRGVPSFVLTADLSTLIHQQAHYIQMTCRGTPHIHIKINTMIKEKKKTTQAQ